MRAISICPSEPEPESASQGAVVSRGVRGDGGIGTSSLSVLDGCPYRYPSRMRTTQRKGDIATSRAIATFTAMGYDVSIPLTESAAYDLVVDDGRELVRVQCKYANESRRQVDLRRIHSNSSGYVVKRTLEGSYDWLYVLDGSGSEYLIRACLANRRSVTLRDEDELGAVAESG